MKRTTGSAGSGLLTVALSVAVALLAVEGLLRLTMDLSDLYSPIVTEPVRHQRHNEARFWQRYHSVDDADFSSHDPLLGWDAGSSRVRDRKDIASPTGLRAVAVGDSFVFGNDVTASENFSARLEQNWHLEVLNMGVPGYGIDQSYLKYRHFGADYHPDIVLFGIYVPDYARSTVAFTAFAKPQFVAREGGVELTNQPVPSPASELRRIAPLLAGRWYLQTFAADLWYRAKPADPQFFDRADEVVGFILRELTSDLSPRQRLLLIHIPRGETFTTPEPVHDEMHRRLLALYRSLGIDHIDLAAEFAQPGDSEPGSPLERFYVIRDSGAAGHLNPAGHRRVAELIAARLDLPRR
jgi:hypothetical protein